MRGRQAHQSHTGDADAAHHNSRLAAPWHHRARRAPCGTAPRSGVYVTHRLGAYHRCARRTAGCWHLEPRSGSGSCYGRSHNDAEGLHLDKAGRGQGGTVQYSGEGTRSPCDAHTHGHRSGGAERGQAQGYASYHRSSGLQVQHAAWSGSQGTARGHSLGLPLTFLATAVCNLSAAHGSRHHRTTPLLVARWHQSKWCTRRLLHVAQRP